MTVIFSDRFDNHHSGRPWKDSDLDKLPRLGDPDYTKFEDERCVVEMRRDGNDWIVHLKPKAEGVPELELRTGSRPTFWLL